MKGIFSGVVRLVDLCEKREGVLHRKRSTSHSGDNRNSPPIMLMNPLWTDTI